MRGMGATAEGSPCILRNRVGTVGGFCQLSFSAADPASDKASYVDPTEAREDMASRYHLAASQI